MLRSTAITKELAVIERKLSETSNQVLKDALKKKQARLRDELNDAKKSTPQLAKKLLAQRAQIKALSKVDFNDLIRRLSKKPEYSFLKTMSKSTVKTDLERRAKPVGWRFKGRGNYDKPTMKEIVAGKRNKTVYREVRPRRSDVNLAVRLQNGGMIGDSGTITDSKSMYQGKMGFIEMDMGNEWIVKVLDNGKEKSVTVRKSGFKILKDDKMENGGVIGQEIVFDDNGERNTGVIKDIHEITGNYVVLTDDGRTVLADKELDVISLGKMRAKSAEAKKRFGFFEDGGNVAKETNEMLMSQIKEVKHHADELSQVVSKNTTIEPWVLAKATRAKTDLSDITHYLDGRKMKYGGKLNDAQQEKFNKVMREWKEGTLHSGKNGPVVKEQDQAIAIAYAQANSMMAFGGMINDDLSDAAIDRMEGLSPNATLDEFIMNSQYIVKSLEEEGFEKDEILSFLAHVMVTNISQAQSSSQTWTQQDQNALEGWISDIQDGYGWITPGYVETSWTSRPGSGTKEWTGDIQRRVYQALIDENMLFRANENDPEKKGRKVKDLTTAMWAASEEMSTGGKMSNGGGITETFEEWSKNYPIEKQADNFYRLYYTKNNFTVKYSKDKSKLEEYRKMMYDLHKSTKYSNGGGVDDCTASYEMFVEFVESSNDEYMQDANIVPYMEMNGVVVSYKQGSKKVAVIVYNPRKEKLSKASVISKVMTMFPKEVQANINDFSSKYSLENKNLCSATLIKIVNHNGELMEEFEEFKNGGAVDGMSTVNEIARLSGVRSIAVAEWGDKNNINLYMVLKDLKSKKIKGMDVMTAVVGKPGNKYSKELIAKYAKMSTGGAMSGWKHKAKC